MRLLPLFALIVGCTWVTPEDIDCQTLLIDEDGDGYGRNKVDETYKGEDWCQHVVVYDCNDTDDTIHPGTLETWYDGIDSNCGLDDDYDADKDGVVSNEHLGLVTEGVEGTGNLSGGDCDDNSRDINPSSGDTWYDGIDSNCDGADDYDSDGDGYVSPEHEGLVTVYVDGSGTSPAEDCDDSDPGVSPDAEDTWYDGIDTNCDGADDYDKDGDQFVSSENQGKTTTFAPGTGALPGGDCDDNNSLINAAAVDTWYDGIDSDCEGDDDYDADLDGFPFGGMDCDDTNSDIFPGAMELIADSVDQDCDGGNDTFTLYELESLSWDAISDLSFTINSDYAFLTVAAESITVTDSVTGFDITYFDSPLALAWDDFDPSYGYENEYLPFIKKIVDNNEYLAPNLASIATDNYLFTVMGILSSTSRSLGVRGKDIEAPSTFGANPSVTQNLSFDDVSIALDGDGNVHALGCTESLSLNAMTYFWASEESLLANTYDEQVSGPGSARVCNLDFINTDATALVTDSTTNSLLVMSLSPALEFVEEASLDYYPETMDVHKSGSNRILVMLDDGSESISVVKLNSLFVDTLIYTLDSSSDPYVDFSSTMDSKGNVYIFAVTLSGKITLSYGIPSVDPSLNTVEFNSATIAVDQVAIQVGESEEHLYVAYSGLNASTDYFVSFGYAILDKDE